MNIEILGPGCPRCHALRLKRRIGAGAGLLFRGSGFYTTDYRSASYKAAERKAAPPSGESSTTATKAPSKQDG